MTRGRARQQQRRLLARHVALPAGGALIDLAGNDALVAQAVAAGDRAGRVLVTCGDLRAYRATAEGLATLGGGVAALLSDGFEAVDRQQWEAVALTISPHFPPVSADRLIFEAAASVAEDGALWLASSHQAGKRARGTATEAFGPGEKVASGAGQRVDRYPMRDAEPRRAELEARAADLAEQEQGEVSLEVAGRDLRFETRVGVFSYRAIDPGTKLLLDWALKQPGAERILDVGCGYGPIGVAAAATWPEARVDMVEVEVRSAGLAETNVKLNGLTNCSVSVADAATDLPEGRHDLALSNLPAHEGREPTLSLLGGIRRTICPSGKLAVVVPLDSGLRQFAEQILGRVQVVATTQSHEVFAAPAKA